MGEKLWQEMGGMMDIHNALAYVAGTVMGLTERLNDFRKQRCYWGKDDAKLEVIIKEYNEVTKYITAFLRRMDERRKDERRSNNDAL